MTGKSPSHSDTRAVTYALGAARGVVRGFAGARDTILRRVHEVSGGGAGKDVDVGGGGAFGLVLRASSIVYDTTWCEQHVIQGPGRPERNGMLNVSVPTSSIHTRPALARNAQYS